jgi:membrane associated rhomboid family serine protease
VQFRFPRLTPTVKKLLILLAATFVVSAVLSNLAGVAVEWLALDLTFASGHYVNLIWQPFTYWLYYPPVPDALFSFALTLLFLYFFLAPFEESFGAKRTLQLIATGVLSTAAGTIALAFLLHALGVQLDPSKYVIFGADPIALAALGAFPIIARNAEIYFMFLVRMKAWHAVLLGLAFAALAAVLARNPFTFAQHAAALGGGVMFARWITRPRSPKKAAPPKRRAGGPDLRVVRGGDDDQPPRWLN